MTAYHQHMTQRVPSDPHWKVNCTAYSAAMAITDATLGGLHITGQEVRALSDEPTPQAGSPGLNIPQIVAVSHHLRVEMSDQTGKDWATVMHFLGTGRRVVIQVDYASLGAARCQANGDFGHAMCLVGPGGPGHVFGSDPLCRVMNNYRENQVRLAAETFGQQTHLKAGAIRFAVTRTIGSYKP